jgi:hypothetical protein
MKERIYLIGQISTEKEITYRWRQDVKRFLSGREEKNWFEIIDPCDNEWNMDLLSKASHGPDADTVSEYVDRFSYYNGKGSSLIVPKDYSYVKRSSGCIANMNHYDLNKPIIGTLFELAWYYEQQEKCVIGIFSGDWTKDKFCNHPFVRETVDVWCEDHMEAAKLLKYFYRREVYHERGTRYATS